MSKPPIEGIDYEAGLKQYQMEKIYLRILNAYLKSVPDILNDLLTLSQSDLPNYTIKVHGLKGASYGVQANHIGDLAKELECAGKEGNTAFIEEKNQELIDETNALLARLRIFMEQQE